MPNTIRYNNFTGTLRAIFLGSEYLARYSGISANIGRAAGGTGLGTSPDVSATNVPAGKTWGGAYGIQWTDNSLTYPDGTPIPTSVTSYSESRVAAVTVMSKIACTFRISVEQATKTPAGVNTVTSLATKDVAAAANANTRMFLPFTRVVKSTAKNETSYTVKVQVITDNSGETTINNIGNTVAVKPHFTTFEWLLDVGSVDQGWFHGNSVAAHWVGEPHKSASVRVTTTDLIGRAFSISSARALIYPPRVVELNVRPITMTSIAKINLTVRSIPDAAFDDFAISKLGHPDPAMTMIPGAQAGTVNDATWQRAWTRQTAPQEYPIPGGVAWPRAKYAAVNGMWSQVPTGKSHYLDLIQLEKGPKAGPSAWQPPRRIQVKVRPDRVNYVKNPSFEVDLAGWSTNGSSGQVITRDTSFKLSGEASLRFDIAADPPPWNFLPWMNTVTHMATEVDKWYTLTARIWRAPGTPYVWAFEYGSSYFSTINTSDQFVGEWETMSISFKRNPWDVDSAIGIGINQDNMTPGQPVRFWMDQVICEEGLATGDYFDGSSSGADFMWEASGTPHNTRSFYYAGRRDKQNRLEEVLRRNMPVGSQLQVLYAT